MKNKKTPLKLPIRYELAYEIIFISIIIIISGLAYLFASNLLRFNWYTVLFSIITVVFLYLKYSSSLKIENDVLSIVYFKFFKVKEIDMTTIKEFIFYEKNRAIEIKSNNQLIYTIHVSEKTKKKLLNWMVNYYPDISCIYISHNAKNS